MLLWLSLDPPWELCGQPQTLSGISNFSIIKSQLCTVYNAISLHHDTDRQAVGVEIILGALSVATRKSLKDLHILDAGMKISYFLN